MKKGWTYKKLGDVCDIFNGNSINADYKQKHFYGAEGGVPFIATKDVSTIGTIDYNNGVRIPNYKDYKVAPANSVFICAEGGSAGKKFAYVEQDVCFGNKLFCLNPKTDSLFGKFVYHYIQSDLFKVQFYSLLTGLIGGVSAKKFQSIEIPLPPLPEQRSIVSRLDAAFADIDALKANAEKQLGEARQLFQSELTECMRPKKGWEEKKFKDLCSFIRGPFGGSLKKECFKESGFAVYEQQNAIYDKFTFRYFIDKDKYNSMSRFAIKSGDLIMSCSGTIGKVAIISDEAQEGIINQALLKLTPKEKIDKFYLKYLMESELFKELIAQNSDGAAIKNIASVAILKEIKLTIPPIEQQRHIVSHLDSLSAKARELEEIQRKTIAECDALKQAILREVFE